MEAKVLRFDFLENSKLRNKEINHSKKINKDSKDKDFEKLINQEIRETSSKTESKKNNIDKTTEVSKSTESNKKLKLSKAKEKEKNLIDEFDLEKLPDEIKELLASLEIKDFKDIEKLSKNKLEKLLDSKILKQTLEKMGLDVSKIENMDLKVIKELKSAFKSLIDENSESKLKLDSNKMKNNNEEMDFSKFLKETKTNTKETIKQKLNENQEASKIQNKKEGFQNKLIKSLTNSENNEKVGNKSKGEEFVNFKTELEDLSKELFGQQNNDQLNIEKDLKTYVIKELKSNFKLTQQNIENMVKNSKSIKINNSFLIDMKIFPEKYGKMDLYFSSENGIIKGNIFVDSQAVKQVVQKDMIQLQQYLNEQGVNIESLDVEVSDNSQNNNSNKNQTNKNNGFSKDMIINNLDELELEPINFLTDGYSGTKINLKV